jgi:hypothetical protein
MAAAMRIAIGSSDRSKRDSLWEYGPEARERTIELSVMG